MTQKSQTTVVLFLALCLFPFSAQAAKCVVVANITFSEAFTVDVKNPEPPKESPQAQITKADDETIIIIP